MAGMAGIITKAFPIALREKNNINTIRELLDVLPNISFIIAEGP